MILEIQKGGYSTQEVLDDLYEAAMVQGFTDKQFEDFYVVDDYGDLIEVSLDDNRVNGDWSYEDALVLIAEDIDMKYEVTLL